MIDAQFILSKVHNACSGSEPVYNMAAESSKFPAGVLLMNGWLSQTLSSSQ